jgi:hypothetical protein
MSSRVSRPVLVVAHPGHELRLYGWMTQMRPIVHVLTDGSGSGGAARIDSTTTLLERVGASAGSIYGRLSDREIYRAILDGDHATFTAMAVELAAQFVSDEVDFVAGDAVEGFNPSHDVCRYVVNAAVRIAAAAGRPVDCYAFALDRAPDAPPDGVRGPSLRMQLDDDTLNRKLQAAHAYVELRSEVRSALERFGSAPFRSECLWPVNLADRYGWDPEHIPYYESFGAGRVAQGTYEHVVTFREHVKPLADALWCYRAVVTA